jgi:hypothetical protein
MAIREILNDENICFIILSVSRIFTQAITQQTEQQRQRHRHSVIIVDYSERRKEGGIKQKRNVRNEFHANIRYCTHMCEMYVVIHDEDCNSEGKKQRYLPGKREKVCQKVQIKETCILKFHLQELKARKIVFLKQIF